MAWGTPLTAVANAALTAAQWNASVRDNLLETAPAKASNANGGYFVTTGTNTIAERNLLQDYVGTAETTTSTSFTDLATTGPSVTATTGSRALVALTASVSNSTVNALSSMGFDTSGATSVSATAAAALRFTSATANATVEASYLTVQNMISGSNTLTAKYGVSAGTATFTYRRVIILPF